MRSNDLLRRPQPPTYPFTMAKWPFNQPPSSNHIQKVRSQTKTKTKTINTDASKALEKLTFVPFLNSGPSVINVIYDSGSQPQQNSTASRQRLSMDAPVLSNYRGEAKQPIRYLDAIVEQPFTTSTTPAPTWSNQPAIQSESSQSWHSLKDPNISLMRERPAKAVLPELNEMDAIIADHSASTINIDPKMNPNSIVVNGGRVHVKSKRNNLYGPKMVRKYFYVYDYPSAFH